MISSNYRYETMNYEQIKQAAFQDELEKIAAIHPWVKSGLIYTAGIGSMVSPLLVADHYNTPAAKNLELSMARGNADALKIIKEHDPSVIPLTSRSQIDTAHIDATSKNLSKYSL